MFITEKLKVTLQIFKFVKQNLFFIIETGKKLKELEGLEMINISKWYVEKEKLTFHWYFKVTFELLFFVEMGKINSKN